MYRKCPNSKFGFSDHSEGNYASLTALGFGISLIERHFTLNKNSWGPDHKASMTQDMLTKVLKHRDSAFNTCLSCQGSSCSMKTWQDKETVQ